MYLCLSFCDLVFLLVLLYNAKLILCTLCLTKFVFFDFQKMQVSAWEEGKMEANGDKEGDFPEGLAVDIKICFFLSITVSTFRNPMNMAKMTAQLELVWLTP